jgi:OmpA-OmpF porin, OOP family
MKKELFRATALTVGWLCAAAIVFPTGTRAAEDGPYVEGRFGISLPRDSELDSATTSQDVDLDHGFVGNVAVGHGYGNGFRTELELGFRENDVDSISGGGAASGDVSSWSAMVNALYDFNASGKLQPYVGVGAGVARLDVSGASPSAGTTIDDADTTFAWQGMAGVAYAVSERVKLTLGYRYFAVPDASINNSAGTSFDSDYASHDILFGLRYSFGAPKKPMMVAEPAPPPAPVAPVAQPAPPPVAPAPPPPVVRNFLVFFDFNQSSITPTAQAIIDSAANSAKSATPVKLRLTGHADRAGPSRYNQRLSLRRANAVRAALTRLGVPASEIAVIAKGESEPLVQTADGIREPQNRRVEIILE